MTAREHVRPLTAFVGFLTCVSLVACSSQDGSVASLSSTSVRPSVPSSADMATLSHTLSDPALGSPSQSNPAPTASVPNGAATSAPDTDAASASTRSQSTKQTDMDRTTLTSAGTCDPPTITFDFEPVEPTYKYPYPQQVRVSDCGPADKPGTIIMQVGDSVRVTVKPGLRVGPLSATPNPLVKFNGETILAEHAGTVHIYASRDFKCPMVEVVKTRCELVALKIGS